MNLEEDVWEEMLLRFCAQGRASPNVSIVRYIPLTRRIELRDVMARRQRHRCGTTVAMDHTGTHAVHCISRVQWGTCTWREVNVIVDKNYCRYGTKVRIKSFIFISLVVENIIKNASLLVRLHQA